MMYPTEVGDMEVNVSEVLNCLGKYGPTHLDSHSATTHQILVALGTHLGGRSTGTPNQPGHDEEATRPWCTSAGLVMSVAGNRARSTLGQQPLGEAVR
jgi:hypothetical protein